MTAICHLVEVCVFEFCGLRFLDTPFVLVEKLVLNVTNEEIGIAIDILFDCEFMGSFSCGNKIYNKPLLRKDLSGSGSGKSAGMVNTVLLFSGGVPLFCTNNDNYLV